MSDENVNVGANTQAADPQPEQQQQEPQPDPSTGSAGQTENSAESVQGQAESSQAEPSAAEPEAQEPSENLKAHLDDEERTAGNPAGLTGGGLAGARNHENRAETHAVNQLVQRFPTPHDFAEWALKLEERVKQLEAKLAHHGISGPAIVHEVGEALGEAFENRQ